MSKNKESKNWIWPSVSTLESAKEATRQAFWGAMICGIATFVVVILAKMEVEGFLKFNLNLSALIDSFLFLIIALGLWKNSRIASVSGLALYLLERVDMWFRYGPTNPIISMLFIMAFINGIRGTFSYHKLLNPLPDKAGADDTKNYAADYGKMNKTKNDTSIAFIAIFSGVMGGVIANWHKITVANFFLSIIASFVVVAVISSFMIYTKIGQRLDGGKTKRKHDEWKNNRG